MVGDFVTLSGQVKVRFEASDLSEGSVVEAGIDDFVVSTYRCVGVICGDANGDEQIDIGDVVHLINYQYKEGPAPVCQPITGCGDVNIDGVVDIGDVVHLINYLYKNGPPPGTS